ncbi:hypothetical protein Gbem_1910 [Citrifermentans bemidjiense Bem]|uniref:Uncharacterized protein n=1 Tax=Citrifermentans bemidjiense (strain ATCC BAA-1014 / DSM 16622 / JCM 12645 / Bem) TaxID=404380 RepID=B5EB63_CITBB|nr:hypothetical protein Gbem_1910 [Citrifermentans bemidjiense Bem]
MRTIMETRVVRTAKLQTYNCFRFTFQFCNPVPICVLK